ncbi:MAG: type II CAAX endopeptidase family protein [Chloroflexota bacterium]|nr:type II CAAX endopeptidase family protein [Chloroflexota bacterium]
MQTPIRPARRGTLLLFVVIHAVLITVVNLLLFANGTFHPLLAWTSGMVGGTLVVNAVLLVILIGGICLWFGRLRPYDVGWIPAHLGAGALATLALWAAAQVIHVLSGWLTHGQIALAPPLAAGGAVVLLGLLMGQVFGNALFEELAYRGFLFPQLYLRIHGDGQQPWLRFLLTLLISQTIFALVHIPNRLYLGMTISEIIPDLALLTVWGVLFTLIYLRTDNLFLVVGIHALGNAPTTLFATAPALQGSGASLLIYALAAVGVFGLPLLLRAWQRRPRKPDAPGSQDEAGDGLMSGAMPESL